MQLVVEQKIKTKSLILIFSPFYSVIKKKKDLLRWLKESLEAMKRGQKEATKGSAVFN